MATAKIGGLGKGIGALLESNSTELIDENTKGIIEVDINQISPNKEQPRKNFNEQSLNELADSIKEVGILQPISVNKDGDFYYIIAGESCPYRKHSEGRSQPH